MKIAIIGAGSQSFGRGQVADIVQCPDFRGKNVTLSLVDISEPALNLMLQYAERVKKHVGTDIKLEAFTDRRKALPGADYLITSVAHMRSELWEQAYRDRSRKLLLQALLLDPNVNDLLNAEKMLDEMLRLQADYLPAFS